MTGREPAAGLPLVEALAVLAIVGIKTAENRFAEIELGLKPDPNPADLLGPSFKVIEVRTPTADADLERIDIAATDLALAATYQDALGFIDSGSAQ